MSIDAYDPLYLDRIRLMKLGSGAPPMKDDEIADLRTLLGLVEHILRPTTSSASEYKRVLEKLQMTTPVKHGKASDIGRLLAIIFQDEKCKPEEKTWKLLEDYIEIPLKKMAILSLVAFATMYGKVLLLALEPDSDSNRQLAKSIALLKQKLDATDPFKNWSDTLTVVLNGALDVAARVMDLEEPLVQAATKFDAKSLNKKLLASAVYKIVNAVIICWSQVVEVLIKRSPRVLRETLWRKAGLLDSNVWMLKNKLNEIKLLKDPKQPSEPRDSNEGATHCWRKLRQMLNPSHGKSLPHRNIMSSSTGALPSDEEEAG